MHDLAEYIHEFDVNIEKLSEEQIYKINNNSKLIAKLLIVLFFLLPVIAWTLLIKIIGSLGVTVIPDSNEDLSDWRLVFYFLPLAIFYILGFKLYRLAGHFIIRSMVKEVNLMNLEAKVEELDNKLNPLRTEKPLSPKVQKEIDKIRVMGKKSE